MRSQKTPGVNLGFDIDLYWKDISQYPLLTLDEERALFGKLKQGDKKARMKLINSNLRLVIKIVGDYVSYGLPAADLISEGNIGLMIAVDKFKLGKGAKLSTYAALWIRQRIRRALSNQSRVVRLPVHVTAKVGKIAKARHQLRDELGREPTGEETAKEVGISLENLNHYDGFNSSNMVHLDAAIGGEEDSTVADIIADESAPTPAQLAEDFSDWRNIRSVLTLLRQREREIICLRFGIDCRRQTLEEVGRKYKLTRERIRQVEVIALRKLRRFLELQEPKSDHDGQLEKPKLLPEARFCSANQALTMAS